MHNLQFGYSFLLNTSASSIRNSNISYSGIYPDLFNITISENGVYDYGNYTPSSSLENLQKNNNNLFSISSGFSVNKNNFSLGVLLNYNIFLTPMFKGQNNEYISENYSELNSINSNLSNEKLSTLSFLIKLGIQIR